MNSSKHQRYNYEDLFDAKKAKVDYTFGFGTDNPADLNIEGIDLLSQGCWMSLQTLLSAPRGVAARINTTPQKDALYDAGKLVKQLWLTRDVHTQEIIGTWVAAREPV